MKTGFLTYWVPEATADMKACLDQHQRTFSGNQLSLSGGMLKVATMNGETPQLLATLIAPLAPAPTGNVSITGTGIV